MTSGNGLDGEPPDQGETRSAPAGEAKTFASGRYLVRRLLGEGAQKTVYLVRDMALERDCALSLIKTDVLDPDDVARFRREAQTMAGLTHGNIVTVHDISEEAEEGPYIVSEYVPGGDLQQELQEAGGPLPLRRAVGIAKDICRALSAAHEQGIIHRDLKPANIWLTKQGSAKLGDFGIAHSMERSRLTMPGTLMGTAA
ncbi:MAG: serine/threonine protein kinase, partial [Chloroflexi bacterium]|nr:serine/threonine protein kinase [Chloroflexota bacterium]